MTLCKTRRRNGNEADELNYGVRPHTKIFLRQTRKKGRNGNGSSRCVLRYPLAVVTLLRQKSLWLLTFVAPWAK